MQIAIGLILLIVCVLMVYVGRPKAGQDSAIWLSNPWILGQAYALAALIVAVIGVVFVLKGWVS